MNDSVNGDGFRNGGDGAPPSRSRPAHMPVFEKGNQAVIVFVTVCTKGRRPLLANDDVHSLLKDAWSEARLWMVGRYVIMTDHVHLFAAPATNPPEPIRKWTSYWKSVVARKWPEGGRQSIWQTDVWDTQLRSGDSYASKWIYVRENPVRAGLVGDADDWPHQGEVNVLRWHGR
jgi:putative transposase